MKENADKHLDDLSRKIIGKSTVESPSFEFTQTIMSKISALGTTKATTYVPLISKKMWLLISIGMFSVVGYVLFGASNNNSKWLDYLNLNNYINFSVMDIFSDFNVSKTMFYIALLFGIMFAIQIPILKHQLNKRLE
ncbi:hypothetical protein [Psychroserpens sp.]|uniref:hypothetical protein n=1 Tax=Psychroserpens sp. TaxID=2020870 RepID=UPI00385FF6FF